MKTATKSGYLCRNKRAGVDRHDRMDVMWFSWDVLLVAVLRKEKQPEGCFYPIKTTTI